MQMLQGVWKQHLRLRAVVGYSVKIFLPSPPNYVTRSPGSVVCLHYPFSNSLIIQINNSDEEKTKEITTLK